MAGVTVAPGGFQRVVPGPIGFGSAAAPVALWNTAASPPLYTATATVLDAAGSAVLDELEATIGVRSAVFDSRAGFLLNGVKVQLKGTANHLGFGGVGMAVPDRIQEFQVATLKAMGSNAFRTAHNPVAPELLDYADRYGMLVWEENRFVTAGVVPMSEPWEDDEAAASVDSYEDEANPCGIDNYCPDSPSGPNADAVFLQDAQDMVLRDRNHPSIVLWSLCNELGCMTNDPNGGVIAQQFKQAILQADGSRPVTGNTVQAQFMAPRSCADECYNRTQPPYSMNCTDCGKLTDVFADAMDVQSFSYKCKHHLPSSSSQSTSLREVD